jgi:hypothetical protein
MTHRKCNVCFQEKSLEDYHNCKSFPLGKVYTCKPCAKAKSVGWNKEHKERKRTCAKLHYEGNKESYLERAKNSTWAKNNQERVKELSRLRWENSPEKYYAYTAQRRAKRLQAMPPWLSKKQLEEIGNIYRVCKKVSQTTGKEHHVDHVIPLQGENVCGLHVPWNLAIIPAKMNLSKSNKLQILTENWI